MWVLLPMGLVLLSAWRPARPIVQSVVLFALLGPLVGTLAALIVPLLVSGVLVDGSVSIAGVLAVGGFVLLFVLPFGYYVGIVPAAVTGAIAGLVGGRVPFVLYLVIVTAVGAIVSAAFVDLAGETRFSEDAALFAVVGGFAAAVCSVHRLHAGRARPRREPQGPADSANWTGR